MILNLTEVLLDNKRIRREVPAELEELDYSFGSYKILEASAVDLTVEKDAEDFLHIRGKALITVQIPCDRCLDDVSYPLAVDFHEKVPSGGGESPMKDPGGSGNEEEDEIGSSFEPDYFLNGYNLDVDKLLFGEALLNWPSRVLCSEDCLGLCPVCGQNLNRGDCGCMRKALDPRMAKVLDVFSNFKEV